MNNVIFNPEHFFSDLNTIFTENDLDDFNNSLIINDEEIIYDPSSFIDKNELVKNIIYEIAQSLSSTINNKIYNETKEIVNILNRPIQYNKCYINNKHQNNEFQKNSNINKKNKFLVNPGFNRKKISLAGRVLFNTNGNSNNNPNNIIYINNHSQPLCQCVVKYS